MDQTPLIGDGISRNRDRQRQVRGIGPGPGDDVGSFLQVQLCHLCRKAKHGDALCPGGADQCHLIGHGTPVQTLVGIKHRKQHAMDTGKLTLVHGMTFTDIMTRSGPAPPLPFGD